MRQDKQSAIKLRKLGKSYREIRELLHVPKSTLSGWFQKVNWTREDINILSETTSIRTQKRIKLMSQANRTKWELWRETHREQARKEFAQLITDPLFSAGTSLYWGEGDHNIQNGKVKLINTDPHMITVFSNFLRFTLRVPSDKIRCWLILYPDLIEKECKLFWSEASKVPLEQFGKTQFIQGRHLTRRTRAGMCTIEVYSRGLTEKIFIWINLLYKKYAGIV